jgi:hypothetical protein
MIGVLYGLWYQEIINSIDIKVPDHAENRIAPRRRIMGVLCSRAGPLAVASVIVAMVFLPPSIRLGYEFVSACFRTGLQTLKQYDPIRTAFCAVELFALSFAAHSVILVGRLLSLWMKLGPK